MISRGCALPLRWRQGQQQVLVFDHPLAGRQVVKGRPEPGETPVQTAIRELAEECGHRLLSATDLGLWEDEAWQMIAFDGDGLPDHWTHRCHDDGGHLFAFHWWPLATPLTEAAPLFVRALAWTRARLETTALPSSE